MPAKFLVTKQPSSLPRDLWAPCSPGRTLTPYGAEEEFGLLILQTLPP